MANRSYIYSFEQDKKGDVSKIFDISEQNYEIPVIYKILVSVNTELVPSKLFEDSLALKGDAKEGRERLDTFFKKLHKAKVFDKSELNLSQTEFTKHLDLYTLDYFLFEPVELIDEEDTSVEVKKIFNDIANYDAMVSSFISEADDECWGELGIDPSSCLYFSLGDDEEVERIAKQFSNKKLNEIKEKIAKKPTVGLYLALVKELDWDEAPDQVNEAIDKATKLKPTFKQWLDCAHYHQDLDRKIEINKYLLETYPKDAKDRSYAQLSRAYKEKKEYQLAFDYYILDLVHENDPLYSIYGLEDLVKELKLDKQETYKNLASKVKNKKLEILIIETYIKDGEYEKARLKLYEEKDFLADGENVHQRQNRNQRHQRNYNFYLIDDFFYAGQVKTAIQLAKDCNEYDWLFRFFEKNKQPEKALYYLFKDYDIHASTDILEFINQYLEGGKYADENVDIPLLFETLHPKIGDFKSEAILDIAQDLFEEWPHVLKALLTKLAYHQVANERKIKTSGEKSPKIKNIIEFTTSTKKIKQDLLKPFPLFFKVTNISTKTIEITKEILSVYIFENDVQVDGANILCDQDQLTYFKLKPQESFEIEYYKKHNLGFFCTYNDKKQLEKFKLSSEINLSIKGVPDDGTIKQKNTLELEIDYSSVEFLLTPNDESSKYIKYNGKIIYISENSRAYENPVKKLNIDQDSLKVLNRDYIIDHEKVFREGCLQKLSSENFQVFNYLFAGNHEKILTTYGVAKVKDPKTFDAFSVTGEDYQKGYGRDKLHLYFFDEGTSTTHATISRACKNPSTFKELFIKHHDDIYGMCERTVYINGVSISLADAKTWEYLGLYSKDKKNVFYHTYKAKGADTKTIEIIRDPETGIEHRWGKRFNIKTLEDSRWAKDKNHYYRCGKQTTKEAYEKACQEALKNTKS